MTRRGIAYQLWSAIEDERLSRGWTGVRIAEEIGVPRNTISRLKDSPRPAQVATVHKIAAWLGISNRQAEELAGLREPERDPSISAREAIERDPMFTDEQRQTMLDLYDMIRRANGGGDLRQAG